MKFKNIFKLLFILSLVIVLSCGKKEDNKTDINPDKKDVTDLIKKDSVTGKEKITLKYKVTKGEKFYYKMTAKTSSTENSPATEGKDIKQENEMNYFYSKEVQEVDNSGIITFVVKYDSINIVAKMDDQSIKYSSNVNDSMKTNPAFIQYNSVINQPFFIRVTAEGEITDVYGLEKIYDNLFKALGDTLNEEEKETIKGSFGKESIREILQQEYQLFPKQEMAVDSSWIKSYNTQVLFFEVQNDAKYVLKGIEDKDNQKIANIEAVLNVEFKSKEVKEKGVKFKIENAETSGSGKIAFNLNKGCIINKETVTNLGLNLLMSAQGQSAKSKQNVSTNLIVTLIK